MRVRIWNAYASNNSGSYTIVGWLPSEEVAREVAAVLTAMIEAHTAWLGSARAQQKTPESPLAAFCRAHSLSWLSGDGEHDDWPEHSRDNRPRVTAIGNQVIVHHEYTVTLPGAFGAFFYKRGGRVQHEEDHAHRPIVTIASFWWGSEQHAHAEMLAASLTAPDGVLMRDTHRMWPAAWRVGVDHWPLTVGIVFEDLIEGVSALNETAGEHGAQMQVRLHEAPDDEHDPLAHLRPSSPPPTVPRFDVVVRDAGDDRPGLVDAIFEALEWDIGDQLMNVPCTLARSLPAPRAEAAVGILRRAGAVVDLVRNDG